MKTLTSIALILTALVSVMIGQGKADVDRLGETMARQLQSGLPGWKCTPVEPFGPSSNIVVQMWSSENRIVKVTVAIRQSVEDAKKEIRSFLQFKRESQELSGFGDEAFAPERDGSNIVLRKGRYVIYISTVANVEMDADVHNLSQAEQENRRKSEVQKIGREFAKQLSSIEFQ